MFCCIYLHKPSRSVKNTKFWLRIHFSKTFFSPQPLKLSANMFSNNVSLYSVGSGLAFEDKQEPNNKESMSVSNNCCMILGKGENLIGDCQRLDFPIRRKLDLSLEI